MCYLYELFGKEKNQRSGQWLPGAKGGVEVGRERVEGNRWDDGSIFVDSHVAVYG